MLWFRCPDINRTTRPVSPQFVIPLMLVFITARAVGNKINEGIYDTQISIKKMPFLKQVSCSLQRLRGYFCCATFAHPSRVYKDNYVPVTDKYTFLELVFGFLDRKTFAAIVAHAHWLCLHRLCVS